MVKNFLTLLFSIAVAFLGGCSPIGGLVADSKATLDFIRLEPKRFVYNSDQDDPFKPADPKEGVEVFGVFGGTETPIPIKDVEITISGFPFSTDEEIIVLRSGESKEEGIQISTPGVKDVTISYKGKEAHYRISVGEEKTDVVGGGGGITIDVDKEDWQ